MKTITIIQAIIIIILAIMYGAEIKKPVCENTVEYIYVRDLPEVKLNFTPINERTEKPKPIPTLHFNELER